MTLTFTEAGEPRPRRSAADTVISTIDWTGIEAALSKKQLDILLKKPGEFQQLRLKVERALRAHKRRILHRPESRWPMMRQLDSLRRECEGVLTATAEVKAVLRRASDDTNLLEKNTAQMKAMLAAIRSASASLPADHLKASGRMRLLVAELDKILFEATGQRVTRSLNKQGSCEFARRVARLANQENASIEEAIKYVSRARRKSR